MVTGSVNSDYLSFLVGILVFALISADKKWVLPFMKTLISMCLVHAVATLLFFLLPDLGETVISGSLLSQYPGAWDYRSALTGSYSWNGMYTAIGFVMCAALTLSEIKLSRVGIIFTVIFALALVLTTKRAHLLFSIVAFIVVYLVANRGKGIGKTAKFFMIAGLAVTVFLFMASYYPGFNLVLDRFAMGESDDAEFLSGRIGLWDYAIKEWLSSPIIGHGWGSYAFNWIDGGLSVTSVGAHCVPLQLLAECGLLGLATASVPYIYYLHCLYHANSQLSYVDDKHRWIIISATAFFVFFTLYAICGNPLYDPPMFMPFFAFYSIICNQDVFTCVGSGNVKMPLATLNRNKPIGVSK